MKKDITYLKLTLSIFLLTFVLYMLFVDRYFTGFSIHRIIHMMGWKGIYFGAVYLIMSFAYSYMFTRFGLDKKARQPDKWTYIIVILLILGFLLVFANISYWKYWNRMDMGELLLNVAIKYLYIFIFYYPVHIITWILSTLAITLLYYRRKKVIKTNKY